MSDIFRKPSSGEQFAPSARQFGAFIDAARWVQSQQKLGQRQQQSDPGIVFIRNDTGGDLDRFSIVKFGDTVVTPDDNASVFSNTLFLKGEEPNAAGVSFAVLQEPAKDGAIRRALAVGVTQVRVTGTGPYADVTAPTGSGCLQCGTSGPARVLWAESGATERWGLVHLGAGRQRLTSLGAAGFWTIAEYDPVTGDILQTFDRGVAPDRGAAMDNCLLFSSDGYLYAAGSKTFGGVSGHLRKWDIDSGEIVWGSADGVLHPPQPGHVVTQRPDGMLAEADDGAIWLARGPNSDANQYVGRYDPATGSQTHEYGNLSSLGYWIIPVGSSGQVIVVSVGLSRMTLLDASGSVVVMKQGIDDIGYVPLAMCDDGNGHIVTVNSSGVRLAIINKSNLSIATVANPSMGGETMTSVTADGTTIWVTTSGPKYRAFNYSFVEQWNAARDTDTSWEMKTVGGNLYDFATCVRKINPSNGAEIWQTTPSGGFGSHTRRTGYAVGSDFLISTHNAPGNSNALGVLTGTPCGLICLNESNGAVRWWDNVNVWSVVVTPDDRIFAATTRRGWHQ